MNFYDIHTTSKALLAVVIFLILCIDVVCLGVSIERKRIITGILTAVCCGISIFILGIYASNMRASIYGKDIPQIVSDFSKIPLSVTIVVIVGVVIIETVVLIQEYRFRKSAISHSSIKESFDHLNTGLCFSRPNGMVMMVNHRMMYLGFVLTGEEIQDARLFWEVLRSKEVKEDIVRISEGDVPEFLLPDGTIWTFRQEILDGFIQLTAAETTTLHRLMEQLKEENENLETMYQRIHAYGDKVDQYTIAKERLETRVNLHSFLGQALLTTRHYLQYENGDVNKIIAMWQRNIDVLKLEAEPQQELDSFIELKNNAQVVGIKVITSGIVPKEPMVKRLLASAGVEAVINAGKHAGAKALFIKIEETESEYVAYYTNDGELPSGNIVEGGGLSSLRAKIERAGGKMDIVSIPKYMIRIVLRKEEETYD